MKLLLAIGIWIALVAPVSGQQLEPCADCGMGRALKVATILNLATHGADLATTEAGLMSGGVVESNLLIAPFSKRPATFGAAYMGFVGVSTLGRIHLAQRGHRRAALIWTVAETVIVGVIATHNAKLVHR